MAGQGYGLLLIAAGLIGLGGTASAQPAGGSLMPCPETASAWPPENGGCACWAPRPTPIWGTDVYTAESAICAAALHAGVIRPSGGTVQVIAAPGQASYTGSTRNGVTSASHGAAPRSFRVQRYDGTYGVPPGRQP